VKALFSRLFSFFQSNNSSGDDPVPTVVKRLARRFASGVVGFDYQGHLTWCGFFRGYSHTFAMKYVQKTDIKDNANANSLSHSTHQCPFEPIPNQTRFLSNVAEKTRKASAFRSPKRRNKKIGLYTLFIFMTFGNLTHE
jgi:hypothetical protein